MGLHLIEEMTNENRSGKKKSKKKHRDLDLENDEITEDQVAERELHNTKMFKSKKRHTSVYPGQFTDDDESESLPKNQRLSEPSLPSNEMTTSSEIVTKTKKKKKKSVPIYDPDTEPELPLEVAKSVEEILPVEEIAHTEDDDFYDGWTKEDLQELFIRMEQAIPKNDSFRAASRLQKLDWEKIKFNNYTAAECQEKWKYVEKKVRGFRLLSELLSDAKDWLEKPWTDFYRSERKNRHPGMPKRPLTSFMLFYMDKKKKYAKKYPNLEMSKLSKIMAEKFHMLSDSKREKYKRLASAMREEYNEKMHKFIEEHPKEAQQIKKAVKTKKEKTTVSGPKKPMTPFKMFYQDKVKRYKEEGLPVPPELLTECKEKWKDMSNRKKMPWIRWAHEAEVKYLEEIKLYTAENPNFEAPPYKSVLSKVEKEILDRVEGKPEKPPNSAYSLFSRLMLKDPKIKEKFETPKQRLQEIARLWKEVPKIEREEYAEKVKHLLENYKLEYATYLDSLPEDKREEELASNAPKKKIKPDGVTNSKKKLKQTTLTMLPKTPEPNKNAQILMYIDKDKRTKVYTEKELLSLEPMQPPEDPFAMFRDEYLKKGLSEKKAIKAWSALSDYEKKNYEQMRDAAQQHYITNYRSFLKSLKPEELSMYSQIKKERMKLEKSAEEEEDDDDEEDEEVVDEEIEEPVSSAVSDTGESSDEI